MDAKNLLLNLLAEHGKEYGEKLRLCHADFSKSAVHHLRTSIRRLLATLAMIAFVTSRPKAKVGKLSNRLKDQLDDFGDLRDLQVMLDQVSEDVGTLPELEPFKNYLEKREKRKKYAGGKQVEHIKMGNVEKWLLKICESVETLSAEEVCGRLPQAVDEAYLMVIQRYGEMDPAQLASIHHLRIAFKNFRYMVETLYPCLPDFPEAQLKCMRAYQTWMGNIQDTEVLLDTLTKFSEENDSYDPQPVRLFYEQVLAKNLSTYLGNKNEVISFWRATPLTVFPWEAGEIKKKGRL